MNNYYKGSLTIADDARYELSSIEKLPGEWRFQLMIPNEDPESIALKKEGRIWKGISNVNETFECEVFTTLSGSTLMFGLFRTEEDVSFKFFAEIFENGAVAKKMIRDAKELHQATAAQVLSMNS